MKHNGTILLGHGSGGILSHKLIKDEFAARLGNGSPLDDAAVIGIGDTRCAFTTDSFVVDPLFFPGGDIGKLAVCGTINDLCMMGAKPLYLSLAMILEEGFPLADLRRIVDSIATTARAADVEVVTGDTKVVARRSADKVFINTTGVGKIEDGFHLSGENAREGDAILINGTVGDHGIAILSKRAEVSLGESLQSDCAPLNELLGVLKPWAPAIHVLRDPTRGGVATTLNEIAGQSNVGIELEEQKIPVAEAVTAACELLGFDPLYLASEGRMLVFVEGRHADGVLAAMRLHPLGRGASCIGHVVAPHAPEVILNTSAGGRRIIDMLAGEQLPRIC
jgi:hydrogenase expression/formation protein HypE